jgi:hypothetical protein
MVSTANRPYAQIYPLMNATRDSRGGSSYSRWMLRAFTLAAAAIAFSSPVQAHLWESKAEVGARLGRPVRIDKDPTGDIVTYDFKQFRVSVTFLHGRSQRELYAHTDHKSQITPQEIDHIISMTTHGDATWQVSEGVFCLVPKGGEHPIALAAYVFGTKPPFLAVVTAEFVEKFRQGPGDWMKVPP